MIKKGKLIQVNEKNYQLYIIRNVTNLYEILKFLENSKKDKFDDYVINQLSIEDIYLDLLSN